MILSFFRNLRAKIIGAKVGHFVSLDRRGNFVDSGYGYQDLQSPLPSGGTNGQVLTKGTGDNVSWKDVPTELPSGGSVGQVLTLDVNGDPMWENIPREVPLHSSADAGKFLRVNSGGGLYWDTVSAGTGLYVHHIRVWKTNNADNVIAEGYVDILTTNLYPSTITTLTDLDDMLGYMVGNMRVPANGYFMTSSTTGYTHEYLKFNGTYFAFYYYATPNSGISDAQGLVIDTTDTAVHLQDDLTTL